MLRRLATLLLALAVLTGGVATCPCIVKACAVGRAMPMDCCDDSKPGIGAPDCCPGGSQLSQQAASPLADSPARSVLQIAWQAEPVAAAIVPSLPSFRIDTRERGGAPPGRTLLTQHTSLLL